MARPLSHGETPRRIVVIRLQAFGDIAATLPILAALRDRFPGASIGAVTGPAGVPILAARTDVDEVFLVDPNAARLERLSQIAPLVTRLRRPRTDVVLDLQRSRLSRLVTRLANPRAWASFDRFAPETGLVRYRAAAETAGLGFLTPAFVSRTRPPRVEAARALLSEAGREPSRPLVCLNPAGGWPTKQWALARYAELGRRLVGEVGAQLLLLGEGPGLERLAELKRLLSVPVLDLAGRLPADVAMAAIAECALVVSDDSGLMHLGWAQGVPAIALFGASRSVWSRADGPRSCGFYSEDLPCGACLQPVCARGDLLCLDRVSVEDVLVKAREVLGA
jgi:heptosyltransferase-2